MIQMLFTVPCEQGTVTVYISGVTTEGGHPQHPGYTDNVSMKFSHTHTHTHTCTDQYVHA